MVSCTKVRYPTGAVAKAALRTIRRKGDRAGKKPTRVYACPHCHGWHLTSEPR
jgi:hypothetical protein